MLSVSILHTISGINIDVFDTSVFASISLLMATFSRNSEHNIKVNAIVKYWESKDAKCKQWTFATRKQLPIS